MSQSNPERDVIRDHLELGMVGVLLETDALGAGFLIDPWHVITCAHTVNDVLERDPHDEEQPREDLELNFPFADRRRNVKANVVAWRPVGEGPNDIAVLRLKEHPPPGARPVRLVPADRVAGHKFVAWGFPLENAGEMFAEGIIQRRRGDERIQVVGTEAPGQAVRRGFSGTAVWDEVLGGVIGMVVAADPDPASKTAYLVPTDVLETVWPNLKIVQPRPVLAASRVLGERVSTEVDVFRGRDGTDHVFDGESVPEHVLRAAQSAGLTPGQLQATAAAVAATPQLATERGRGALFAALQDVVGPITRTDNPDADLLDLVSAVLDRHASAALFGALRGLATNEAECIDAIKVRHGWELQAVVAPLLDSLQRVPKVHILGALAETVCDVPEDTSDLAKVLELLADLHKPGSAASPLAEFAVRLQQRRPDLEIPAQWFSDQGLDEAAVAALRTSVGGEARIRGKLVIDLSESTSARWQTAVTGYLGPRWCSQTVECKPGADGVRGAVVKIVEWARSQTADLTIGFVLRYELLRELPEQWEYEDVVIAPIRLCEEYPVVLHTAERMTVRQLRPAWGGKLAAIEEFADGPPSVLWLERDDAAAIRRAVQASNDAYVAFTFVPEARPDPRTTAVTAAIAAGAPYVVWVQAAPASDYNLCERLGQMLGPIRDFPATLLQRRAEDPYMSDALRVIWDRLDELPPFLDRLGKELN